MMSREEKKYMKANVVVEPLVNQWYAWSNLISPATAALYMANQHLKIMQSFTASPQVHVSALKNPAMIGGPFINYPASRVNDIRALIEKTVKEQSHMLKLAEGIQQLDKMLANEATGFSIEPLYEKTPDILRGYVELVYDLNHHPSMRLIEGLLYRSPFYNDSSQSVLLSLNRTDDRPFAFSTPRLDSDNRIHLQIPLASEKLSELFKMKAVPQTVGYIKEILGVRDEDDELFASLFTEEKPSRFESYTGEGIRLRYFGHACVLMETKETTILCDPVISYEFEGCSDRYTYADLPESIDYILITHNHQDHCMFETLLQLRHKVKNVIVPKNNGGGLADPSLKLVLEHIGFRNVREIDEMESVEVDGGYITGLPFLGEHGDLNIRTKMAYFVSLKGRTALFAADSNNLESRMYEHIHEAIGDVDVLFIGMECDGAPLTWLYGPLITKPVARKMDQSRRFDGSDHRKGIDLVNRLKPGNVYVYAMGQEPWLTYLTSIVYTQASRPIVESNKLIEDCQSRALIAERLYCQKEIFLDGK